MTEKKLQENEIEDRELLIELRKSTGMNRKDFSLYFEIPYRTMTDWERGERRIPRYLLHLMQYKVGTEKISKKGEH